MAISKNIYPTLSNAIILLKLTSSAGLTGWNKWSSLIWQKLTRYKSKKHSKTKNKKQKTSYI